jgi:hypothetical protein
VKQRASVAEVNRLNVTSGNFTGGEIRNFCVGDSRVRNVGCGRDDLIGPNLVGGD